MDLSPIRSHEVIYPIFFWAALLIGIWLLMKDCKRYGLACKDAILLPIVLVAMGRLGALLLYSWEHDRWSSDWLTYASFGMRWGSSQYGAIYAGILVFIAYAKIRRIEILRLMDITAPAVALAIGVGRLGCYAANCCRGVVLPIDWRLPSFLPYPEYFPASFVTAAVNFIIAFFLYRMPIKSSPSGRRIGWFLLLAATERFFIEFVRESEPVFWGLTLVQCMALPLLLGGLALASGWGRRNAGAAGFGIRRSR